MALHLPHYPGPCSSGEPVHHGYGSIDEPMSVSDTRSPSGNGAVEDDEESLFGGSAHGSDGDSLFGGDDHDDVTPSLTEDRESSVSSLTLPTPTSQPALALPWSRETTPTLPRTPTIPDPPEAPFISHKDGHTSGLHMVSIPTPSAHLGRPPDEGLELEAMMEAELLRDQEINTDISHDDGNGGEALGGDVATPQATPFSIEGEAITDDFDALMEFEFLKGPAIRGTAGFEAINQGELGISVTEIPGFRWPVAATRRGIRLPRRIDLDEQHVEVLVPYITLHRGLRKHQHFEQLEITWETGRNLVRDVRRMLNEPENIRILASKREAALPDGKRGLLGLAFRLLKDRGLGPKYFGAASIPGRRYRQLRWPNHSTLLLCRFANFLNKQIDLEKQKLRTRKKSATPQADVPGSSSACPVDLVCDAENLSPRSSAQPSSASGTTSPTPAPIPLDTVMTERIEPGQDSSLGPSVIGHSNIVDLSLADESPQRGPGGSIYPPPGVTGLDEVRKTPSASNDYWYRFSFREKNDGRELSPPVFYRQSDEVLARGAFDYAVACFATVAIRPIIQVVTPQRPRAVYSQKGWDAAVSMACEALSPGEFIDIRVLL